MNAQGLGRLMLDATRPETLSGVRYDGKMFTAEGSVPTDGDRGYAKGCLLINRAATDHSNLLYCNIGTASSCNFNLVTVASD